MGVHGACIPFEMISPHPVEELFPVEDLALVVGQFGRNLNSVAVRVISCPFRLTRWPSKSISNPDFLNIAFGLIIESGAA